MFSSPQVSQGEKQSIENRLNNANISSAIRQGGQSYFQYYGQGQVYPGILFSESILLHCLTPLQWALQLFYECPSPSMIIPSLGAGTFPSGHKHAAILFIFKDAKKHLDCICPPGVHATFLPLYVQLLRIPSTHTISTTSPHCSAHSIWLWSLFLQ